MDRTFSQNAPAGLRAPRHGRAAALGLASATALALASCSLAPVYTTPATGSDISLPSTQGPTVSLHELGYKDYYRDPRLQTLIEIALKNNRDLRKAALAVKTAQAAYGVSVSALFPMLGGMGSLDKNTAKIKTPDGKTVDKTTKTYFAGLGAMNYELDLFGKAKSGADANFHAYLAGEYGRRATQLAIVGGVAKTYFATLAAEESGRVAKEILGTRERQLELDKLRLKQGVISDIDFATSSAQVEQARMSVSQAENALAMSQTQLAILIGGPIPEDLPEGLPLDRQFDSDLPPANLSSDILLRRPDVAAAEEQLKSRNASIGAARAAFFPSISLTGTVGRSSEKLEDLFEDAGMTVWGFAPKITLPIFTFGARLRALDVAKLRKESAILDYESAIQGAFKDVADALNGNAALTEQAQSAQKLRDDSKKIRDLAHLSYKAGMMGRLELFDAERGYLSAGLGLTRAKQALANNKVDLFKAFGGGLVERQGQGEGEDQVFKATEKLEREKSGLIDPTGKSPDPKTVPIQQRKETVGQALSRGDANLGKDAKTEAQPQDTAQPTVSDKPVAKSKQ